jgi:7-cyano-7-deazaguanine synthase
MASGIPVTYVPARNTLFLALALGLAETLGSTDLVAGMNAIDYSGYPDCRPEFVQSFESLARLATRAGVEGATFRVHTPLMRLGKADIIRLGSSLGVDFRLTHSCYDPDAKGLACGACDACLLRRRGFHEAGIVDPTRYAAT